MDADSLYPQAISGRTTGQHNILYRLRYQPSIERKDLTPSQRGTMVTLVRRGDAERHGPDGGAWYRITQQGMEYCYLNDREWLRYCIRNRDKRECAAHLATLTPDQMQQIERLAS